MLADMHDLYSSVYAFCLYQQGPVSYLSALTLTQGVTLQDRALCNHVLSVHQTGHAPERTDIVHLLDAVSLRSYIAKAKHFNPFIPEELTGVHAVHILRC